MKVFVGLISALLICGPALADDDDSSSGKTKPTVKQRLSALEVVTVEQQEQIDEFGEWIGSHESEQASSIQIEDELGNQVGQFLGFANNTNLAITLLDVEGYTVLARVTRNSFWWDEKLLYTTEDCSGQAYMREVRFLNSWIEDAAVISPGSGSPDSRLVFRQIGPAEEPDPPIIRFRLGIECGEQSDPPGPVVPVMSVNYIANPAAPVDLHLHYERPFWLRY